MRCPRRDEYPDAYPPDGPDRYAPGHGLVTQARGCTYCGSMDPDDFMDAVRAGATLGPTDKSYKVYIDATACHGKFYFQHLGEAQRREFFELFRDGRLTVGYPGRFYVLPFFIGTV